MVDIVGHLCWGVSGAGVCVCMDLLLLGTRSRNFALRPFPLSEDRWWAGGEMEGERGEGGGGGRPSTPVQDCYFIRGSGWGLRWRKCAGCVCVCVCV